MCTVSFVPTSTGVWLTSNRDEKYSRKLAGCPGKYKVNGCQVIYPADKDAGGSWIGMNDNGYAAVLINGAFVNHVRESEYRRSRGLVFIELLSAGSPNKQFDLIDLSGIAPFTIIFYIGRMLAECRWDGQSKYVAYLNASRAHIWSSVTLYDKTAVNEREAWFQKWLQNTPIVDRESIFRFHRFGGNGDVRNDLVMTRDDQFKTVSITSMCIKPADAVMYYFDMAENKQHIEFLDLKKEQEVIKNDFFIGTKDALRRAMIIATHWEYWPFHIVYTPLYLYWLWLSVRARSFFFFSAANPSIENAGFTHERKSKIYDLIPKQYYPATVLCKSSEPVDHITKSLQERSLVFPLIAKPDIGERGTKVKLLSGTADLIKYAGESKVDFLLQEYISYEQEIGIFYYRLPGQAKGRISGIVGKELLTVTGDGRSTIEELVRKEKRYFLQLEALKKEYGNFLQHILAQGSCYELVPYGNHCRGAKFTDLGYRITNQLTQSIDNFCRQVPGFYFGRMDIKFRSWDDLEKGENFSVIELNGAGSEPTHIYDPAHSIFFAWKEIIRHWNILYSISKGNRQKTGLPLMQTNEGLQMLKDHRNYMKLLTAID